MSMYISHTISWGWSWLLQSKGFDSRQSMVLILLLFGKFQFCSIPPNLCQASKNIWWMVSSRISATRMREREKIITRQCIITFTAANCTSEFRSRRNKNKGSILCRVSKFAYDHRLLSVMGRKRNNKKATSVCCSSFNEINLAKEMLIRPLSLL